MSLIGVVLAATVYVPPGALTVDHTQPYHWAQPTIRTFERRPEDNFRHHNWNQYVRDIDGLWKEYRRSGSTTRAWKTYKLKASMAKQRFIFADPYYAPIVGETYGY